MVLTEEMLAELSPIIKQEVERFNREEQERKALSVWKRLKTDFEPRISAFDYIEVWNYNGADGTRKTREYEHLCGDKIIGALRTLLLAVFETKRVALFTPNQEPELRDFMDKMLSLMEDTKKQLKGANDYGNPENENG